MKVFKKGFVLVSCSGQYSDYHESILAFSISKEKLEKLKIKLEKEQEAFLARFKKTEKARNDYMELFRESCPDSFTEDLKWVDNSEYVKDFLNKNPIPDELDEFIYFEEYPDGTCDVREIYELESELDWSYRINSF